MHLSLLLLLRSTSKQFRNVLSVIKKQMQGGVKGVFFNWDTDAAQQ